MSARLLLALASLGVSSCTPGPAQVADRFVDAYFVEMDQKRALGLSAGLAQQMLDRELRDVIGVRKQMGEQAPEGRPEVFYERRAERKSGPAHVYTYDLTVRHQGDSMQKVAEVAVEEQDQRFRVVFFRIAESESPRPKP